MGSQVSSIRLGRQYSMLFKNKTKQDASELLVSVTYEGKTVIIPRSKFTIGAKGFSDICIDDGTVTRRHIQVELTKSDFTIQDLGSDNGVYLLMVDGQKLGAQRLTNILHVNHSCTVHMGEPIILVELSFAPELGLFIFNFCK